ncbi:MAG: hypothetical protein LBL59_03970 [Xanthomonadaceae bacterium]|jgi:hypothetical protein|nr:hypothetical protein [Xanthomonadaceae bacterium]
MLRLSHLAFSLLLSLTLIAAPLAAQPVRTGDIETQMTPAEFQAAGLEKLTPQELAALNAWLQGKVKRETEAAVAVTREETRKEIEDHNRGFFHFGSREPIASAISGQFDGFAMGRRYTLENGQVWEQIDSASIPGARKTGPQVTIRPAVIGNAWYMQVQGYNTTAKVQRIE